MRLFRYLPPRAERLRLPINRQSLRAVTYALCAIALQLSLCASTFAPSLAGDFPGVGNPGDWSDALPYYNRGNRYLNQGRYDDAAKDFQEAIAHYQDDPDFYINLGMALQKTEKYKEAETAFKTALKMKPKDWVAWQNLGAAYLKQDRIKDVLGAYDQALKCNPPAEVKAQLLGDIADIHKFLRATGQEPLPAPKGAKVAAKTKVKANGAKVGVDEAKTGAAAATPPEIRKPPVSPKSHDWGYD